MKKLKKIKAKLKFSDSKKTIMKIVRDDGPFDQEVQLDVIGYDSYDNSYLVKIPENVCGYVISQFHILHYGVNEKLLGQRFNNFYYE